MLIFRRTLQFLIPVLIGYRSRNEHLLLGNRTIFIISSGAFIRQPPFLLRVRGSEWIYFNRID